MEYNISDECEDVGTFKDLSQFLGKFDGKVVKPLKDQDLQTFQKDDVVLVFNVSEIMEWYDCIRYLIDSLKSD